MRWHRVSNRYRRLRSRHSAFAQGDSCGCAMGVRFLAVVLPVAVAWYEWRWHSGLQSASSAMVKVLLCSFLASIVGKIFGLLMFYYRSRRIHIRPISAK